MGDNLWEFPRKGGTTNLDTQSFTSIYVLGIIQHGNSAINLEDHPS